MCGLRYRTTTAGCVACAIGGRRLVDQHVSEVNQPIHRNWQPIDVDIGPLMDARKALNVELEADGHGRRSDEEAVTAATDPAQPRVELQLERPAEHRRRRAAQAGPGQSADSAPARRLCPRRPAAFRPGEMVSRRAAAALGLWLFLAQGWHPGLARLGTACRYWQRLWRLP